MPIVYTPGPLPQPQTLTPPLAAPCHTPRTSCRACDSHNLDSVIDLGTMALPRFMTPEQKMTVPCPRAPLHLVRCRVCGLLQLADTADPKLLFTEFWYRSGINQSMRDSLEDMVDDAVKKKSNGVWLDIGANDGTLLQFVPTENGRRLGFQRIACEPAQNFAESLSMHADHVVPDYFSFKALEQWQAQCDVITSAAMFYDVDDPRTFVHDVAKLLAPGGIWVNQLNDSPTMMKRNAFDAICHEHLCYYDVSSLRRLYLSHGLVITDLSSNEVNGGSIRVTAMKNVPGRQMPGLKAAPEVSQEDAEAFAARTHRWHSRMTMTLTALASNKQKVWGYGASTKGAILLQYLGGDAVQKIADRNPLKHGRLVGGTWTPIVSEEEMRAEHPDVLLMLPWAFRDEFTEREKLTRRAGTALLYPLPDITWVL